MPGKLYLIPTPISEENDREIISSPITQVINELRLFIVEEEKSARRFLKKANPTFPLQECTLIPLNEHASKKDVDEIFKKIVGKNAGIISQAGCPCVADPGADIVSLAHTNNMEVIPLIGPSSILLALMASGLNGQNFAFNGYLPKDKEARIKKLKDLEKRSQSENQTQIFMEAPHHNESLFQDVLSSLSPDTFLCLACDLTGPNQLIKTLPVKMWQGQNPSIHKKPTLFLIQKCLS